jgi:hypothetical protein
MKNKPNLISIEGVKRMAYLFKFFILSLLPIAFNGLIINKLYAQDIDNVRMSQDIEVAERILEELFGGNRNGHDFGNQRKSHGIYLRDYGVILQVPAINLNNFAYAVGQGNSFSISGDAILDDVIRARTDRDHQENKVKSTNRTRTIKSLDSLVIMRHQKILDKMQSFYTNYGDLIGQLKDNDKIMLVYDSPNTGFGAYTFTWNQRAPRHRDNDDDENDRNRKNDDDDDDDDDKEYRNRAYAPAVAGVNTNNTTRRTQKIVMEVSRGDINQYKTGKLSKEQFINKIKVQEEIKDSESELEFDILAGIFEKIAKRESNDFYFNQKVRYQRLANFGVMYDLELHSEYTWMINKNSWSNERLIELKSGVYILDGQVYRDKGKEKEKEKDKYKLDKETKRLQAEVEREKAEIEKENQEKQVEMEKFEKEIKENLIQYGRTLRSLKADEFLALNIKFKSWGEDNTPKNIMFTVKKTVLEAYDKREISLEDAMSKIEVKK